MKPWLSMRALLEVTVLGVALHVGAVGCGMSPGGETPADNGTDPLEQLQSTLWTAYTSEEYPPVNCLDSRLVAGVACSGRFCDNVAIDCVAVSGLTFGASSSTPFFSEEGSHEGVCSGNEWMTGIQCHGDFCDNLSIRCTETNRAPTQCAWTSGTYSEENSPFQVASIGRTGFFIRGIRCFGSNCDNKQYLTCRPL
ncbi:MAG TPA: hypothetical protein VFZ09_37080 [Archangium sp.]|uniref:hypothetical protein n=1 Tax=Archangium sp. TaxID=1872627 RepID=UPI002E2F930C|nr:hypothetical protein [Archangium sp.]HEX5751894.1 hypothetical protein [Archangium sp.]